MTIAQSHIPLSLDEQQHIVLEGMSWDFYEQLLKDIGDRPHRVTFDNGSVEIMSPHPKHDGYGLWIASLLVLVGMQREITVRRLRLNDF